jgi:exodeoxyribonuclease-3
VKIATFNINNVNKRLDNLIVWLERTEPDVVCLQELKAEQQGFPATALRDVGYSAVWQGERSWNGVAILARSGDPVLTRSGLPGDSEDIDRWVRGEENASDHAPAWVALDL